MTRFLRDKIAKPIKRVFLGGEDNKEPLALGKMAFVMYVVAVMILVGVAYPFQESMFRSFFANLTQDLIIAEVNPARQELENLGPLRSNPKLQQAAQMKAEDMIARDYFSHNSPEGERPWVWLNKVDYKYALAGENLAIDYNDPYLVTKAWLNSPSHRENILNGYFTDIGIGVAEGEFDGRESVVVVMFLGREITPTLESLAAASGASEEPPAPDPGETDSSSNVIYNIADIKDGDLLKSTDSEDIYIAKITGSGEQAEYFKRVILNPSIFDSYAHLSWSDVKIADPSVISQFETTQMVMEVYPDGAPVSGDIYVLSSAEGSDKGTKHHLALNSEEFDALGYDRDAVYNINHLEASDKFYPKGNAITLESLPSFALIPEFKTLLRDDARYQVVAGDSTESGDMAVVQLFKDSALEEESNVIASVVNHDALYAVNEPAKVWAYAKNFFFGLLPQYTKIGLIVFFTGLLVLAGMLAIVRKMGAIFFAPRMLILVGLIALLLTQLA